MFNINIFLLNSRKLFSKFFFFKELPLKKVFYKNVYFYFLFYFANLSNFIFSENFFFKILDNTRLSHKLKQVNNNNIYVSNNRFTHITMFSNFLTGFKYLWLGLRLWILPIFVFFLIFFFLSFSKMVPFYKFTFIIFIVSSFSY